MRRLEVHTQGKKSQEGPSIPSLAQQQSIFLSFTLLSIKLPTSPLQLILGESKLVREEDTIL